MRTARAIMCGFVLGAAPAIGLAQSTAAIGHADRLLIDDVQARGGRALTVSSPSFSAGAAIPDEDTQYGANRFPGLRWTPGPVGTRSYVVAMQGALRTGTSIHLTLTDVPAGVTSLPAGMTTPPVGARYGLNVHGAGQSYVGPHTHGPERQPYHLQVFALDTLLATGPAVSYPELAAAMRGHVLAEGEMTGYAAMPPQTTASERAPVRIDSGMVSGVLGRDPSITVYKGIPYAAPPVGDLRWRPPVAPAAWSGVRRADRFGDACPQPGDQMARGLPQSEDCLTLNLWTGTVASGEKRPVFVWIYGGGFLGGSGASPEFDGEGLARKGVIVVTFNYRVGVLGFLATPELSRESGHGSSGDYGLMDDIAVLKWVQHNIAAFGGDPSRVTIGGQSAGAGSVGFLSISPLAKGLFRTGIEESHARYPSDPDLRFLSTSYRTLPAAEVAGVRYADAHGARTLADLRRMPWRTLVQGSDATDAAVDTRTTAKPPLFRPVIDGWLLPRDYSETLAEHAQNDVLIVAGNNADETGGVPETAFAPLRARSGPPRAGSPQVSVTLKDYVAFAHEKFGPMADEFLRLYPAATDDQAARANNEQAHDNNRVSTWLWATEWRKGTTKPVYTYWWTHAPPGPDHDLRGAYHGSEINYVFDNLYATDRPWTDEDRAIADRMSSYWANIVKTGDPNGAGLPTWPAFAPAASTAMRLGEEWRPVPIAGSAAKIDFWRRYYRSQTAW